MNLKTKIKPSIPSVEIKEKVIKDFVQEESEVTVAKNPVPEESILSMEELKAEQSNLKKLIAKFPSDDELLENLKMIESQIEIFLTKDDKIKKFHSEYFAQNLTWNQTKGFVHFDDGAEYPENEIHNLSVAKLPFEQLDIVHQLKVGLKAKEMPINGNLFEQHFKEMESYD